MQGFKLLSIMPLEGCHQDIRKNLVPGKPYTFYQDYKVTPLANKGGVKEVVRGTTYPNYDKLYKLENGINLNIAAVVGQNGSGKSTIFELLYYFVYLLGTSTKINGEPVIFKVTKELGEELDFVVEDLGKVNGWRENYQQGVHIKEELPSDFEEAYNIIHRHKLKIPPRAFSGIANLYKMILQELIDKKAILQNKWREASVDEKRVKENLAVSILYEVNESYHEVRYSKRDFLYKNHSTGYETKGMEGFDFEDFFYTISLNYSHHSLNTNTIGPWISRLFHKNDAYRTPVVINPMRDEGNFDINKELALSKERLMSNLAFGIVQEQDSYRLLGKYRIAKFIFRSKVSRPVLEAFSSDNLEEFENSYKLLKHHGITQLYDHYPLWDLALPYLEKKILKTKQNYSFIFTSMTEDEIFDYFITSTSHITKKIRQTLNFLVTSQKSNASHIWKNEELILECHLEPGQLHEWLKLATKGEQKDLKDMAPSEIIDFALPGFFNIDFKFNTGNDDKENEISFGELSSGEQQFILNQSAVIYHLSNLDSVHNHQGKKLNQEQFAYQSINILLDEMELYYHPEWQKQFIYELHSVLGNIPKRLSPGTGIQHINVIILTHSPFILSDIPSSNILKLGNGCILKKEVQTFAANIHDILADNFFLQSGPMGCFAEMKIRKVISVINSLRNNESDPLTEQEYEALENTINLVDEPVLKEKLLDMFGSTQKDSFI